MRIQGTSTGPPQFLQVPYFPLSKANCCNQFFNLYKSFMIWPSASTCPA